MMEFGCTMVGDNSPLHTRSPEILARNFPPDGANPEHNQKEPPLVIDLHPCFLEREFRYKDRGKRWLVCEAVDQTLDENSVDAGLQALAVGLINGLPVTIGPELTLPHEFDPNVRRLVSIYPSVDEDGYNMLMMDMPHITSPLGSCISTSGTPESCMENPTADIQKDSDTTPYTDAASRSSSIVKTTRQKLQGLLDGSVLIRCWFQLNEQTLSGGIICALGAGAGFTVSDLADSDLERDSDTSYRDHIQDSRNTDSTGKRPGHVNKRDSDTESDTDSTYFRRQALSETLVDRWFLCWTGSGSKMLCEIPDWYTGDDHHPQSKHVRRATLQTAEGKVYTPLLTPTTDEPLHFLADSPPLWQHCRYSPDPGSYTMQCLNKSTRRAAVGRNRASRSKEANRILHRRDASTHASEKGGRIISDQPPHNITSTKCGSGKPSAFGKLSETFAFIGFFTVLAVFTIVLSWLVKHLFLAIYDGLEEWTDSRRRKRALATAKDFGISDSLGMQAPAYDSTGRGFQRPVDTVALPQTAVVNEEAASAITATGSQAADGGSDSVKRKKAAMRATVSEETEL